MSEPEINPIGGYYPLDAEGCVVNRCRENLVPPVWRPPVDAAIRVLREKWGDRLLGVYLRGSVPAGTAVEGQSDLDVFAMLKWQKGEQFCRWEAPAWMVQEAARLQSAFPYIYKVELMAAHHDPEIPGRNPRIKMLLATQSLCVFGQDLIPDLPAYRPGPEMCMHFRWLEDDFLAVDESEGRDADLVRGLMKTLVRAGFELVMEREGQFATDLYPCWRGFSKYYPERSAAMRRALVTFLDPAAGWKLHGNALRELCGWLSGECRKHLGSH